MKRLLQYGKGYGRQAVLAPLFKMLEASFELMVPLVMAAIIDTGIQNSDKGFIFRMCLNCRVLLIARLRQCCRREVMTSVCIVSKIWLLRPGRATALLSGYAASRTVRSSLMHCGSSGESSW